jgi:hypothetical protein
MYLIDYRRMDQRTNVLENPFWLTSALIKGVDVQAAGPSHTITATDISTTSGAPDSIDGVAAGFVAAGFSVVGDPIAVSGFTGAGAAITANNRLHTSSSIAAGKVEVVESDIISDAATEAVTVSIPRGLVLFSFPVLGRRYMIQECQLQLIEAFTTNTQIYIGLGTIATDLITTGGLMVNSDFNAYFNNTDITIATPAYYGPTSSTWYTAAGLCGSTSPRVITGAVATVPVIYAIVINSTNAAPAAIAAGQFRLHLQIAIVPGK